MENLLKMFGLEEQFEVHRRDANEVRCLECNEIIDAGLVDLHSC